MDKRETVPLSERFEGLADDMGRAIERDLRSDQIVAALRFAEVVRAATDEEMEAIGAAANETRAALISTFDLLRNNVAPIDSSAGATMSARASRPKKGGRLR